jgi:hypothetical protein
MALGNIYFQIDDKATPDKARTVKALDRVFHWLPRTALQGSRQPRGRSALGDLLFHHFGAPGRRSHLSNPSGTN